MVNKPWVLLIACEDRESASLSNRALQRLETAVVDLGYRVIRASTPEDGMSLVSAYPSYGRLVIDWDLPSGTFEKGAATSIVRAVRAKSKYLPIFLIADKTLVNELPLDVIRESSRIHPPVLRHAGLCFQSRRFCDSTLL
jgi:arginine decarboxylase